MKKQETEKNTEQSDQSCWDCKYQQIGGNTFLGICMWFSHHGKTDKEIPPSQVDVGCKYFSRKK